MGMKEDNLNNKEFTIVPPPCYEPEPEPLNCDDCPYRFNCKKKRRYHIINPPPEPYYKCQTDHQNI